MRSTGVKKIVLILTIILGVLLVVVFMSYKAKAITIVGNEICSEEELKEHYFGGPLGDNMIVIWLKERFGVFDNIPFVRDADISIESGNNVTLQVYEKSLIACFYYMGEYIYFDKDGMILDTYTERVEKIPCIEGISFTNFTMNEVIEVSEEGQIRTILALSELINHYDVYVERVLFSNNNEVTLYCGNIKVMLGKQDLYDQQIASVSDVLRQARENGLSGTIDMKNYSRGDKIILKQ